ncbi:hypothetical protein ACOZ4L_02670 [Haloplanus ruber]|uniref:DUF7845 domain-containing protein n=1 Tax=Haloplanus ruber TaxID=869892 RepID=A0ABD6D392_9EURY|nr:hypothetical protein [Haloplanus ruber]
MSLIATAFHEVDLFWWFTDDGLSPYWALGELMHEFENGWDETTVELSDGVWSLRFNYNAETGIAPRKSDSIGGDRAYEYQIHAEGPGEKKADYVVSPRWDDQRKPDGDLMQRPWCGGEGLDVHVQGSNLTFEEYHYLLQKSIQKLADQAGVDISRQYFNRIRPDSNVATVELYVRLNREYAKKLVQSTGVFYKIMHLLAGEEGTEWVYKGDNSEIVGKRHAFDLPSVSARELIDDHRYGKRAKCYHPKHVRRSESDDDPLSSPKFGVAFHSSIHGESVSWSDRDKLLRELDETVLNTLRWAGVPTAPDQTVFVEDDHFEIRETKRSVGIFDDPTPQLKAEQENLITTVLQDLSPSARSVMKTVATDGGEVHYEEVADEAGYSVSQVYRALEEIGDLVVNDNGLVRLYSEKIKQEITGIVERIENFVADGVDAVARLASVETRSSADSAIQRWMSKYGADFKEADREGDCGTLRFDTVLATVSSLGAPDYQEVLEEGLSAWMDAGRDPAAFAQLRFEAEEILGQQRDDGFVGRTITW